MINGKTSESNDPFARHVLAKALLYSRLIQQNDKIKYNKKKLREMEKTV